MKRYYHGTERELELGTVLVPGRRGGVGLPPRDRPVLRLIEQRRPKALLGRKKAIFLAQRPQDVELATGDPMPYVYRVKPIGKVSRHHWGWIEDILWAETGKNKYSRDEKVAMIDAYWAGKPYRGRHTVRTTWEVLVPKARIVELVPKYSTSEGYFP